MTAETETDTDPVVDGVRAGNRRAIARLLTRVEDGSEDRLRDAVRQLHPHSGRAHLIGLTGAPGVGKSTITSALVAEWRRREHAVGVLAIDPSSPFSGGALLGDRVRMQDHVMDEGVFVRSMASRGHLGGLSWATPQGLLVLDAAGYDPVIVETVGTGQAEVEVASVADTTIVALAPGMGDAIQAAKAGVLEVADVFCVNKADRPDADRTVRELSDMRGLGQYEWTAPIHKTVAAEGTGVPELADALEAHRVWLTQHGKQAERRRDRARLQLRELALAAVRRRFAELGEGRLVDDLATQVADRELDPYSAADRLVAALEA
jgi:LAO/AO transport system kinase